MERAGKLISFEGGEGSGKSTQIRLLAEYLQASNIKYIITREPGGTPLAEKIRPLLVCANADDVPYTIAGNVVAGAAVMDGNIAEDWHPLAETSLFMAARIQHWYYKIKPALEEGKWVLCDRFIDSTVVYQGVGKQLGVDYVLRLHNMLLPKVMPDTSILLDIDPILGLNRAKKRGDNETRFEKLDNNFHQDIRTGFLQLARNNPKRFAVIDANQSKESVAADILEVIKKRFGV